MSKRIVIDARESGTTTGRYIDKLIEHLHKLHPKHTVIILTRAERLEHMASIAPNFVVVETPFKEFTFSEQLGFMRQLNGLEADLVHFGMVQQPVLYHGPVVTTMHDLTTARFRNPAKNPVVFTLKQQVYKWVNKKAARKSAAVITPTQYVKDDVVAFTGVDPGKITVTYEAADAIAEKPEPLSSLEGTQFILYIGRPTPHKNLGRLISAYAELKKTRPELKLVLAGKKDALYEAHEKQAAEAGVADVVFTGFVSEGQLRWLYEHTAAYVFPSLSEGFGLPPLEAMLHGAPVVSSNATCLPEVNGDAAHYFDPLDVTDMAIKIGEVLDDPILREDLVTKGAAQAAKYSWTRMANQTLDIYEKVLATKPTGS
jgi:glycosyltransferase involved in cell wall biosynthesis